MPAPKDVFGANVAHERKRQGHTMRSLAGKADVYPSEISRIERGQRDPRLWTIFKMARALDVPIAFLLRGIGKPDGDELSA